MAGGYLIMNLGGLALTASVLSGNGAPNYLVTTTSGVVYYGFNMGIEGAGQFGRGFGEGYRWLGNTRWEGGGGGPNILPSYHRYFYW